MPKWSSPFSSCSSFWASTDSRAPQGFAPLTIGLAVALINWAGIPVTNLSINPARSAGTAVFADGWALQQLWLFWVAPILGAAIAGVVYPFLAGRPPSSPQTLGPVRHGRRVLGAAKADVGIMFGRIAFGAKGGPQPIGTIDIRAAPLHLRGALGRGHGD